MEKKEVLEVLKEMFSGCGDVMVYSMNNDDSEVVFKWRICRKSELGSRMNWSKCKKILGKKGISWIEGDSGYGLMVNRSIDFSWNG